MILVRAFDARRMPALGVWHRASLDSEFQAGDYHDNFTFQDYLRVEERLFKELEEEVYQKVEHTGALKFNRYSLQSPSNPRSFSRNWNRSFEFIPTKVRGGALFLHGLTDSPYSLRGVAEIFKQQGFYVLGLRIPGHGTIPAALTSVTWEDWLAATKIGAAHVRKQIDKHKPFYVVGYSNGGALAVKYTLDASQNSNLPMPQRLVLFSPAIGVSRLGAVANWHKILSFVPYFEKFNWTSIEPEYDPFKYNSFSKNAGDQIYQLTRKIQGQIDEVKRAGQISKLPPILTFQSLVDSTVLTPAIIEKLHNKIENPNSELVIFDINRHAPLKDFLASDLSKLLLKLEKRSDLPYRITVITNASPDSLAIIEKTKIPRSKMFNNTSLGLTWPRGLYSLSHVAIPFAPEDPVYGSGKQKGPIPGLRLGSIEPRGERNILRVSVSQLMRLRYNPFFDYVKQRLIGVLSVETD
jgi:alpha-beta hydrolase superfamily lysophospholipase